ncbi:MAG: cytochrome C [Anaerolineales bacterium]|nr:MAG: cytochrome C [Anaerolineales bacterium]
MKKSIRWILIGILVLALAIQLVPYGHDHTNPPVRLEPTWDSEATRSLTESACFDCHSDETLWPWYSNVAPVSWLIERDVAEGRSRLDFSEWDSPQRESRNASRLVQAGEMPPWYYALIHANARLSSADKTALEAGLKATLAQ